MNTLHLPDGASLKTVIEGPHSVWSGSGLIHMTPGYRRFYLDELPVTHDELDMLLQRSRALQWFESYHWGVRCELELTQHEAEQIAGGAHWHDVLFPVVQMVAQCSNGKRLWLR